MLISAVIWNKLPTEAQNASSISAFKNMYKQINLYIYFNPHVVLVCIMLIFFDYFLSGVFLFFVITQNHNAIPNFVSCIKIF